MTVPTHAHLFFGSQCCVVAEISHGAFAGVDRTRAISIAISVAQSLQFLNEGCMVMHGDVKHRK